jgi:hypothetical protein
MPSTVRIRISAGVISAIAVIATSAAAHHSVLGQFDVTKTITLKGTITKVEWINPHPYVHLNVAGPNGAVTAWALSTVPLAMMRKAGITKETLAGKPGEIVTVAAHPALNGRPMAWVTRITYADGHFYALFE